MSEQYFTQNPTSPHQNLNFDYTLLNQRLTFHTDAGVFSKRTIDFGTRLLIETFADYVDQIPGKKILDLGAGYGPVGISLAKKFNLQVDMTDVNERSLELAKSNAQGNRVQDLTNIFYSDRYQNVTEKYGAILVNPPVRAGKEIVSDMLNKAISFLVNHGQLFVVLQKKQGAPSAKKIMEQTFTNAEIVKKDKGYYIIRSFNNGK